MPKKKWNLDEDGSDEDEPKKAADQPQPAEDEVDPLDAFMQVGGSPGCWDKTVRPVERGRVICS